MQARFDWFGWRYAGACWSQFGMKDEIGLFGGGAVDLPTPAAFGAATDVFGEATGTRTVSLAPFGRVRFTSTLPVTVTGVEAPLPPATSSRRLSVRKRSISSWVSFGRMLMFPLDA